jgi:alanine racemase
VTTRSYRPTRAEIAPGAIRRNVERIGVLVAPAAVCAVVKGDGYGHGIVTAASAALEGGATWLGVALAEEAFVLRDAGFTVPVLLLSEPVAAAWGDLVAGDIDVAVYSQAAIDAAQSAAASAGRVAALHLKVDTGMHRVGCAPGDAIGLAHAVHESPRSRLAGLFTHFATADDPASMYPAIQLERYRQVDDALADAGIGGYLRHAANSAGAIAVAGARFDLVRCGIACYGIAPSPALQGRVELEPALRLVSAVSHVKRLGGGEPVSYGCRFVTERETTVITVPIGYADGLPRSLGLNGGYVLVGGRRRPVVGTVTMDQLMVDAGDLPVAVGDEVVLLGTQGDDEIDANEMAAREGSIGYEIVTRLGPRVPRVTVGPN